MHRTARPRDPSTGEPLLKMSELAERSGLPSPTIQHYLREGLLGEPAARTGRTMAWYDKSCVARLLLIRSLQHDHYLPLAVIRSMLRDGTDPRLGIAVAALSAQNPSQVKASAGAGSPLRGLPPEQMIELVVRGLIANVPTAADPLAPADAELVDLLVRARQVGLGEAALPIAALAGYQAAVAQLVAFEVALFRDSVLRATPADATAPTEAAVELSEAFVLLMRRRLLPPALAAAAGLSEAN